MTATTKRLADPTTYRGRLARAIVARRLEIGMSVIELAKVCGVSRQCVYLWEWGDYAPNCDDLPSLAKALKTTPRRLIPPS